jgi:hypothetical protein
LSEISTARPVPLEFNAKDGRVTSVASLHQCVKELDQQIDSLEKIMRFFSEQLDEEYREMMQHDTEELEYRVHSESGEADLAFECGVKYINRVLGRDCFATESPMNRLEKIDSAMATLDFSLIKPDHGDKYSIVDWEREVTGTRRSEIDAKQDLVDAYRNLLPRLHPAYLAKFYVDYLTFPAPAKFEAMKVLEELGALNFHHGLLDNSVEILIGKDSATRTGVRLAHVAIDIGGIVYERAPSAWALHSKARYISAKQAQRATVGYVFELTVAQMQALLQSVSRKIQLDEKYSVIDHSCLREIISVFQNLEVDIVDPRRYSSDNICPSDIVDFLEQSGRISAINQYPKK